MSKINILSENLANKIAAGEVIERVSSVVKELVENSLDAKANTVKINLIDSGLKEITIIDNGIGMDSEDALKAFTRHATSKIKRAEDLFFIGTLGFRGEALPSIASVSEVVLITSEGDAGTKVHIKGGVVVDKTLSDARVGTAITITNLFYNTPARLKFLKSESSELAAVTMLIEKMALSHPNVSFILSNNNKIIIKTSGSDNLHKTIHEIYGLKVSSNMLYLNVHSDDFIVTGFVSKPEILKTNRNDLTTFVNNRLVKNLDINKAINDAYYTYKPHDRFPIAVINIETDPTLMDVNIHPTKQDIKLSKINDLYNLIYKAIKDLLYANILVPKIDNSVISVSDENKEVLQNDTVQQTLDFSDDYTPVIENKENIKSFKLYPVGLVHGTYIIAENEDGMYLIDQHAAAERINYEKYLEIFRNKNVHKINMLVPITIEMPSSDYIKFENKKEHFISLGFDFEEFGINTIIVKSHPDYLKEGYEEEAIKKIIELIINLNKDFDRVKYEENLAITLSCKMSIKANHKISHMEQEYFLKELVKCDNPYNCPHGRPTIITYSNYDLEKLFKRVV